MQQSSFLISRKQIKDWRHKTSTNVKISYSGYMDKNVPKNKEGGQKTNPQSRVCLNIVRSSEKRHVLGMCHVSICLSRKYFTKYNSKKIKFAGPIRHHGKL